MRNYFLLAAIVVGLELAYIDTRPNWDDTGVTVAAIFACCALLGALEPEQPWFWALAIGAWVPMFNIALLGNYGSTLALVIAFAGAYAGEGTRRVLFPASAS